MKLNISPVIIGISISGFRNLVKKLLKDNDEIVGVNFKVTPRSLNISLLNLINIWYKTTQSNKQYLIVS